MRIGIVTFWKSKDNYGQLLQCWALQQYLKTIGHTPFLIRYDYTPVPNNLWVKRLVKLFLIYPILKKLKNRKEERKLQARLLELDKKNKQRHFDEFRDEYIESSSRIYYSLKELREDPPVADCYMTGSDQTWAQMVDIKNNWAYFLSFGDAKIPRIAYAPSFARDKYPKKLIPKLGNLLSCYSAISVRESSGVEICKCAGYPAEHVIDPTFLLSKEDYISLLGLKHAPSHKIFLYSMNVEKPEEIRWDELKAYAAAKKKQIVCTVGSGLCPGFEIYGDDVEYKYPTIKEWIEEIWNADFVVTSSFHGVVFSIIMETPFVYIPLSGIKGKGNSRVFELLERMSLENRILIEKRCYADIDENSHYISLEDAVDNSRQYLKKFL